MYWKCGICEVCEFLSLRELLQHIHRIHAAAPAFHIFCGIDNCPRGYGVYTSFYKHVRKEHPNYYESEMRLHRSRMIGNVRTEGIDRRVQIVGRKELGQDANNQQMHEQYADHPIQNVDDPLQIGGDSDDAQSLAEDSEPECEDEDALTRLGAEFLMGLKDKHEMTQRAVQDIRQGCSTLTDRTMQTAQKSIIQRINLNPGIDNKEQCIELVENAFLNVTNPFKNLSSDYMQKKYLESEFNFIKPMANRLGYTVDRKLVEATIRLIRVPDIVYYVPLKESICQFFENSIVYEICSQNKDINTHGFLIDIIDGTYVKNHPIFRHLNKNCLMFQLYYDDLEICSALSNATRSISLFYYRLVNTSLLYRSRLESIRLFAVAEKTILNKYGMNAILQPFTDAMIDLRKNGWDFEINGKIEHFTGGLLNLIGDTPAINAMGGFKKGVGFAHIKCRHCECRFQDMQRLFQETDFHCIDLNKYEENCRIILEAKNTDKEMFNHATKTFGINERSVLCDCPDFDVTQALPQDIMHIFLEGVASYELKIILQRLIIEEERFSINILNERMGVFFSKFRYDSWQAPAEISKATLQKNDGTLKQNSSQMNSFITAVPFILNGLVNDRSVLWNLISEIVQLRNYLFSPVISKGTLANLKLLIQEHLTSFKRSFPASNIVPKQHFLIHLPTMIAKFGPPIRYYAFRFESKHKIYKRKVRACQNYKNVPFSIYSIAQREECLQNQTQNPKLHPIFKEDFLTGKCKLVDEAVLEDIRNQLQNNDIANCYTTKFVSLCGNKFVANYTFVPIAISNFNFVFGKIVEILIFDMSKVYFNVEIFDTICLSENLQAVEIEQQVEENYKMIKPEDLLDNKPYFSLNFINKLYVLLHYDVLDIINLAEEGLIHFHNKLREKV